MKTVIISGKNAKGSTYHIAKQVADKIGGETKEFFLPKDFDEFCLGCTQCFMKDEKLCPHYEKLQPITDAMLEADVIIMDSPVYVYHVTGQMKAFLDHYGALWMSHSPREEMFKKQGVCITTAAGAGMKSTIKDMADSLFFWGVPKVYKYGIAVQAINWNAISEKKKAQIDKKTTKIANNIIKNNGKVKPGIKTRSFFTIMRMVQKKFAWCEKDKNYWDAKGWTGKVRPWNK